MTISNHRPKKQAALLISTLAAAGVLLLSGCAASNASAEARTSTPAATTAAQPVEIDTTMSAACGQVSALLTLQVNAQSNHENGSTDEATYKTQLQSVQFGIEQTPTVDDKTNAFENARAYMASVGEGKFDPDAAKWGQVQQGLVDACRSANAPVSISQANGG